MKIGIALPVVMGLRVFPLNNLDGVWRCGWLGEMF